MKTLSLLLGAAAGLALMAFTASAAVPVKGEEVTLTGEAKCAMCMLKESDKCQTVIQTEKDGKKTTYYLADNEVAKKFHENVCKAAKKVTATGTVKTVDGKQELTATKIELAQK
jgi:pyridoxine/pyridoxamine 5'-phosphate oxidase